MITESQRNNLLTQLRTRYNGHRVDYWGYAGECVSYVRRWMDAIINNSLDGDMVSPAAPGGANGFGAYYFTQPSSKIRELFDVQAYNPNASYPAGSLFTYTGSGHVGIMLDNQPGNPNALVSEQNADPDRSAVHDAQRSKSRIDGILVIRTAPDPPPQPAAPLWTVQAIDPKQIQVNPGSRKWNLAHGNFKDVEANPITVATSGEVFIARAILHHREIPQYNYYLEDPNTPHGWNVLDCIDYTPPPPAYVPPAPKVEVKLVENYRLVTLVDGYTTAEDAKGRNHPVRPLGDGEYIVIAKEDQAYKLVENNQDITGYWINIHDNKVEEPKPLEVVQPSLPVIVPTLPVDPPPVLMQENVDIVVSETTPAKPLYYEWLRGDRQPVYYRTLNVSPMRFKDLERPDSVAQAVLPANKDVRFSMVTIKNGMEYFIPTLSLEQGNRHGIPETMVTELPQAGALDVNHDRKVNFSDVIDGIQGFIDYGSQRFNRLTTKAVLMKPKVEAAKQRVNKVVDGFSRKGK